MTQARTDIRLQLSKSKSGYSVLAITAGNGNGWEFTADALRSSLNLWDKAQTFLDHSWFGRSVRDLAGVLSAPEWDEEAQGVRATLTPFGPAKETLIALAEDVFESPELSENVGLSADLELTATGKTVQKILRINSVDIVVNPARGGKFLRALNQLRKDSPMPTPQQPSLIEPSNLQTSQPSQPSNLQTSQPSQPADLQDRIRAVQQTQEQILAESEMRQKQQEVLRQMLGNLLDTSLAASGLPEVSQDAVRAQFDGKIFEPKDLTAAIEAKREEVAALTAGAMIQGPGRVQMGASGAEQFEAAVYDLLGASRPDRLRDVKAQRLTGIREMYTLATGDVNFHGIHDPARVRVQFATASSLPNLLADVTNKLVHDQWNVLAEAGYEWWKRIVNIVQVNSMQDIKGIMLGQVDVLPTVSEGAAYASIDVTDNKETASFVKKGGYLGLTLEMFLKDDTRRLAAYPKILASAGLRTLSSLVASVFTSNAGAGPTMADGNNLFSSAHGNLGTAALSADEWDTAQTTVYNQALLAPSGDDGGKLGVDAKYLVVPRALRKTALNIIVPQDTTQAAIGERDDVVVVPEFTDANDWAAVADPRIAPAITVAHIFGLQPEIFVAGSPSDYSVFANDESRIKVRHISAVLVEDYRPLYKSNVANA